MHRLLLRRLISASSSRSRAVQGFQCALDWLLWQNCHSQVHSAASSAWKPWAASRSIYSSLASRAAEPALALCTGETRAQSTTAPGQQEQEQAAEQAAEQLVLDTAAQQSGRRVGPTPLHSVIRAMAKQGDVDGCLELLKSAPASEALNAYNAALRCLPPQQALRAFQQMERLQVEPNTYTVTALVEVFAGLNMLRHLDGTMTRLLARYPTLAHWSTLFAWADAHSEAGNPQGVKGVIAQVQRHGLELTPHYWTLLIKANSKGRRCSLPALDKVFEEMQQLGVQPSEEVFRVAIYTHGSLGHGARAAAAFQKMLAAGIKPSVATYSALINAYSDSSMPEQALETFRAMHREGLGANMQTYVALMKAFARVGDVERSRAVLTTMKWDGLQPNEYAYSCLVDTCAVARRPADARRALEAMRSEGIAPSVVIYTALLSAYAECGDVAGARGVLVEMHAQGVVPNNRTYTALMKLLGDKGLPGEAQAVFDEMVSSGLQPDRIAYCTLVDALLNKWSMHRKGHDELLLRAQELFEGAAGKHLRPQLHHISSSPSSVKIDLHGYSVWGGRLGVLGVLQQLWAQYLAKGPESVPSLQIVTGRGMRSAVRNRSPLREGMLSLLQPLLPVHVAKQNDGLLVLFRRHLMNLFSYMKRKKVKRPFGVLSMKPYLVDPHQEQQRNSGDGGKGRASSKAGGRAGSSRLI